MSAAPLLTLVIYSGKKCRGLPSKAAGPDHRPLGVLLVVKDILVPDAAILMSGGLDSLACAHFLKHCGKSIKGVFVDYGQAAAKHEANAVQLVTAHLEAPLSIYRITGGTGFSKGELIGRNAFLIFATLFLSRCRSRLLALGIHAGTPYFDCSPAFFASMERLVAEHTDGAVTLVAPFLHWTKREVFDYFLSQRLPLSLTYSCEAGLSPPCGMCESCLDRRALGC
jgi:7-cyano-7-deazaguanine synthase